MKRHVPIQRSKDDSREREVPIRHKGATVLSAIFWTLLILSTGVYVSWYFVMHKKSALAAVGTTPLAVTSSAYIEAIGKKILLPKDNVPPRIAVITDPALLTGEQEFYRGAEAGDVLVVFETSKRAIIYSPRRDIIVNVGPVIPRSLSVNTSRPESLEGGIVNE